VGWTLSESLETVGALEVLDRPIKVDLPIEELIHHPGRETQYNEPAVPVAILGARDDVQYKSVGRLLR